MNKHCPKSSDNIHTFKKLKVKLVQSVDTEMLYTFAECIHCGYKMKKAEMFARGTVSLRIATDQFVLPYDVEMVG